MDIQKDNPIDGQEAFQAGATDTFPDSELGKLTFWNKPNVILQNRLSSSI